MRNEDFIYRNGDNWIDLSGLPRKMYQGREVIDWKLVINHKAEFCFKNIVYFISITFFKKNNNDYKMKVIYENESIIVSSKSIRQCKLVSLFSNRGKHSWGTGKIINNSLILKLIYIQNKNNHKEKAYLLKCLASDKEFKMTEANLKQGKGSPYVAGKIFWKSNSLLSRPDILKYVYHEEDGKLSLYANKKIKCKCDNCDTIQEKWVQTLTNTGFNCSFCSKNTSYPERFVSHYLMETKVLFEKEKIFQDLPNRRFDFYLPELNIAIETHGLQHYKNINSNVWKNSYELSNYSDSIKRKYCKKNNITLIELDCRLSDPIFIKKNILNHRELPKPSSNQWDKIFKKSISKEKYDYKAIQNLVKEGSSLKKIANAQNISLNSAISCIRKMNLNIEKSRSVVCINNMMVYSKISLAARYYKIKSLQNNIQKHLKGERSYCGKHPITGEPLKWMYLEDYIKEYGDENLTYYEEKISS